MILFKGMLSSRIESSFTLKNNSVSSICFKIKTSSRNEFLVSPTTSVIRPKEESLIQVTFSGPPEARNKGQKFLIQIAFASDLKLVDWSSKENLEFKLGTKFLVADVEDKAPEPRVEEKDESFTFKNSSVYNDIEFEDDGTSGKSLEDEKKGITEKNAIITNQIREIKKEIEQDRYKLKFKNETSHVAGNENSAKYSIPHVLLSFVIGLFLGFYILA